MIMHARYGVKEDVVKEKTHAAGIEQKITRAAFGIAEAAQSLGCHPDTLRRKANAGELKTIRVGRRVLIPSAELQRILEAGL